MKLEEFKMGQLVLIPCIVRSVDPKDNLYPVKVELPAGITHDGRNYWLRKPALASVEFGIDPGELG